jgi:hypothetical protein
MYPRQVKRFNIQYFLVDKLVALRGRFIMAQKSHYESLKLFPARSPKQSPATGDCFATFGGLQ